MPLNIKLSTEELKLLLEAGYVLIDRREFAKAKEVFEGVVAVGQAADVARMGLAQVLMIEGNAKEAEKQLKEAAKANPKSAHVHAQLGELYHTMGKKEEALAALKQAEGLDPNGSAGRYARSVREAVEQGIAYTYQDPTRKKK
jgi:tetratricopeptide (TPR) repeat protein